jgi:hypothetical protein
MGWRINILILKSKCEPSESNIRLFPPIQINIWDLRKFQPYVLFSELAGFLPGDKGFTSLG